MDLDAGHPARKLGDEAAAPAQPVGPQPVREMMKPDGVQARIAGQHFPGGARRRVALQDAGDVATQFPEHQAILGFPTDSINYLPISALSSPRRMFTSSRSRSGTRENSRRNRSGSLDRVSGTWKPLFIAACSKCAYSPSMSSTVASFSFRCGGMVPSATIRSSYATICTACARLREVDPGLAGMWTKYWQAKTSSFVRPASS